MATIDGRRPTRRTRLAAVAALTLAAVMVPACVAAPPPAPVVAIYGDSLVNSSGVYLETSLGAAAPNHQVLNRNRWGSAVCDWLGQMRTDSAQDVDVVVLAFFGNMGTPCTADSTRTERYAEDATVAVELWQARGTKVILVASPAQTGTGPADSEVMNAFRSVAEAHPGVRFVDAGTGFVDPGTGQYGAVLACRSGEPCVDGVTVVRSPDHIHLCDHDALRSLICPSSAAGVRRFVAPIAAAVAAERAQLGNAATSSNAFAVVAPESTTSTETAAAIETAASREVSGS